MRTNHKKQHSMLETLHTMGTKTKNVFRISQRNKGIILSVLLLMVSIVCGMIGFKYFCPITWTDAFLNTAMLLTGMGPVNEPESDAGKVFAGVYALYSGIIFLSIIGLVVVPVFNKYIQKINEEQQEEPVQ